jgi:(p)ppGpp synthase/HD superfamily hydrolase
VTLIDRAVLLAANLHHGQHRKDQQGGVSLPYLVHPLEVLKLLWSWGVHDEVVLAAAALHDVFEDTDSTGHDVHDACGIDVYNLVAELTLWSGQDKANYLQAFADPAHKSVESLVIKVADRICNVRDFARTDRAYAAKYLLKAEPLHRAKRDRAGEVEKRFGPAARVAMTYAWADVVFELGVNFP